MQRFTLSGFYDPEKRWQSDEGMSVSQAARTLDRVRRTALYAQAIFLKRYADGKTHRYLFGHCITVYALVDPTESSAPWESHLVVPSSVEKRKLIDADLGELLIHEMPFPENEYFSVGTQHPHFGRGYKIDLHACSLVAPLEFAITQREVIDDEIKEQQTHLFTSSFDKETKEFLTYRNAPKSF